MSHYSNNSHEERNRSRTRYEKKENIEWNNTYSQLIKSTEIWRTEKRVAWNKPVPLCMSHRVLAVLDRSLNWTHQSFNMSVSISTRLFCSSFSRAIKFSSGRTRLYDGHVSWSGRGGNEGISRIVTTILVGGNDRPLIHGPRQNDEAKKIGGEEIPFGHREIDGIDLSSSIPFSPLPSSSVPSDGKNSNNRILHGGGEGAGFIGRLVSSWATDTVENKDWFFLLGFSLPWKIRNID